MLMDLLKWTFLTLSLRRILALGKGQVEVSRRLQAQFPALTHLDMVDFWLWTGLGCLQGRSPAPVCSQEAGRRPQSVCGCSSWHLRLPLCSTLLGVHACVFMRSWHQLILILMKWSTEPASSPFTHKSQLRWLLCGYWMKGGMRTNCLPYLLHLKLNKLVFSPRNEEKQEELLFLLLTAKPSQSIVLHSGSGLWFCTVLSQRPCCYCVLSLWSLMGTLNHFLLSFIFIPFPLYEVVPI